MHVMCDIFLRGVWRGVSLAPVVAIDTLSLNSCRHVEGIFSVRVLCRLVVQEARFRMSVTLGFILLRSLVITKHIPGRLRSGSGLALN